MNDDVMNDVVMNDVVMNDVVMKGDVMNDDVMHDDAERDPQHAVREPQRQAQRPDTCRHAALGAVERCERKRV